MDYDKIIDEIAKKQIDEYTIGDDIKVEKPIDDILHQRGYQKPKDYVYGSNGALKDLLQDIIDNNKLGQKHRQAMERITFAMKMGDKQSAELERNTYTLEVLIPIIELLCNATSPDEIANNSEIVEILDRFAPTIGDGAGFTKGYIKMAYQGQMFERRSKSDVYVRNNIDKIKTLSSEGQARLAYATAKKIKERIDSGKNLSSREDYELLNRIIAYK